MTQLGGNKGQQGAGLGRVRNILTCIQKLVSYEEEMKRQITISGKPWSL